MKVGELFVNLGITGADKTIGAITETTKGMGGLASMSLEAKAAILGAMYGLERLMSSSASLGTHLVNLSTLIGVPMKTLQQYDYAAQQVGESNASIEGSFKSLASTINEIKYGKAPEHAAAVMGAIGMDYSMVMKGDIPYVMRELQKFAVSHKYGAADTRKFLSEWGLSEGTIASMEQNAFRSEVLTRAPTYSDAQAKRLQHLQAQLSNLEQRIEMKFGSFFSKHGPELIGDVTQITDAVFKLGESLETLSEKVGVFQTMAQFIEGIANSLKLVSELVDRLGGKGPSKGDLTYTAPGGEAIPGFWNSPVGQFLRGFHLGLPSSDINPSGSTHPANSAIPLPVYPPGFRGGGTQNNHVTVNQTFQNDGKDHKQVGDSVKKAVRDAYNQIPQRGA